LFAAKEQSGLFHNKSSFLFGKKIHKSHVFVTDGNEEQT
jgi:hypothetical protein